MNTLIEQCAEVEHSLSQTEGPFDLFALFLREDSAGKWDLLTAAPWIEKSKQQALRLVAGALQKTLNQKNLLQISRIVIIDKTNPALAASQQSIRTEHGNVTVTDSNFSGLAIKQAHIITSQKVGNTGVEMNQS